MTLTTQQYATVKAYILADPVLGPKTSGPGTDYNGIASAMSQPFVPAFTVWRTSVTRAEIQNDDGFNWTLVDNLSTNSKYRIWDWMFGIDGTINPSKPNIRAGIAATWTGTQALVAVQNVALSHCKRSANVVEKVLATGTGTDADPATMGYEGYLTLHDVRVMFA